MNCHHSDCGATCKDDARMDAIARNGNDGEHYAAVEAEHTGLSVDYYRVEIKRPTTPGVDPYVAECNDIIEALGMTYAEGNVLKAVWRRCAARTLGKHKRGNDALYDAEKGFFFSGRILEIERGAE